MSGLFGISDVLVLIFVAAFPAIVIAGLLALLGFLSRLISNSPEQERSKDYTDEEGPNIAKARAYAHLLVVAIIFASSIFGAYWINSYAQGQLEKYVKIDIDRGAKNEYDQLNVLYSEIYEKFPKKYWQNIIPSTSITIPNMPISWNGLTLSDLGDFYQFNDALTGEVPRHYVRSEILDKIRIAEEQCSLQQAPVTEESVEVGPTEDIFDPCNAIEELKNLSDNENDLARRGLVRKADLRRNFRDQVIASLIPFSAGENTVFINTNPLRETEEDRALVEDFLEFQDNMRLAGYIALIFIAAMLLELYRAVNDAREAFRGRRQNRQLART